MKKQHVKYKNYFKVYVTHSAQKYQGDSPYNNRQRKHHLAINLEGKSLCNMDVQFGEEKLPWESPMQKVEKPREGAGETCKTCWNEANK